MAESTGSTSYTESWFSIQEPENETSTAADTAAGSTDGLDARVVMITVGCVGVLGNGFVIVVIYSFTSMRKKLTNFFIINQSSLDMAVSLVLICEATPKFVEGDDVVSLKGVAGDLYCRLWLSSFLLWSMLMSSTYNLVAITVERYLMVVHPVHHKMTFTKVKARVIVAAVWLIGPCFQSLGAIPSSVVVGGHCEWWSKWVSPAWQTAFGFANITVQYIIPLIVHPTLYAHMALVLRRKTSSKFTAAVLGLAAPDNAFANAAALNHELKNKVAQKNLLKTLGTVTICFFLCWSWNQLVFLLYNMGVSYDVRSSYHALTITAVYLNCCLNPFIYITKYKEFRKAVSKLLVRTGLVAPQPESKATTSRQSGSVSAQKASFE